MFDDCKGDRFIELMAVFSTVVLRRVLSSRQEGKGSISRRIYTDPLAASVSQSSQASLKIAHRFALGKSLAQRKELRQRYNEFGKALDMKDKEVERRFEKIVATQEFLDQNIAPEATVARITKQFEDHWQADAGYIRAVTQGDTTTTTNDAFLDYPFHEIWSDVTCGTYAPDFSLSRSGILEDLENRIAVQATRLHEWKRYRSELQQKNRSPPKIDSPVRKPDILSPKDRATEKKLVFSPRKSPRKSVLPVRASLNSTPIKSSPSFMYRKDSPISVIDSPESPLNIPDNFMKRRKSHVQLVHGDTPESAHNDSGFSEISDHELTTRFDISVNQPEKAKMPTEDKRVASDTLSARRIDSEGFAIPQVRPLAIARPMRALSPDLDSPSKPAGVAGGSSTMTDEAHRANAILAATFNAASTPSKPPLTLEERTRQSLALTSPSLRLASHQPSTNRQNRSSLAQQAHPAGWDYPADSPPLPQLNLADRTRQSISIATLNKPKPQPRKSLISNRRDSRVFPVNQFETPGKGRRESGFDERAGYDSVFKSRPKVGMSPRGTPVEEVEGEDEQQADLGVVIESPLGRMGVV